MTSNALSSAREAREHVNRGGRHFSALVHSFSNSVTTSRKASARREASESDAPLVVSYLYQHLIFTRSDFSEKLLSLKKRLLSDHRARYITSPLAAEVRTISVFETQKHFFPMNMCIKETIPGLCSSKQRGGIRERCKTQKDSQPSSYTASSDYEDPLSTRAHLEIQG